MHDDDHRGRDTTPTPTSAGMTSTDVLPKKLLRDTRTGVAGTAPRSQSLLVVPPPCHTPG